jgi:hypothetical protein
MQFGEEKAPSRLVSCSEPSTITCVQPSLNHWQRARPHCPLSTLPSRFLGLPLLERLGALPAVAADRTERSTWVETGPCNRKIDRAASGVLDNLFATPQALLLIQTVEPHSAPGHYLMPRLGRQQPDAFADHLRCSLEEAVLVRAIGRPHDLVRADIVGRDRKASLDRLERDPAIPLEQNRWGAS